jgi:U3 small nucleolar RNA-associated protein 23
MRAKRSKKYRKLMNQYELTFGFREPYQVLGKKDFLIGGLKSQVAVDIETERELADCDKLLRIVDSNFLRSVYSFKMDLIPALERTLQGKVKPST